MLNVQGWTGRWPRGVLAVVLGVVAGWTVLAWRSGAFLPDSAMVTGWTPDGFSHHKKLATLPSGTVAYVDQGQGPPVVLLHGCPFSTFEWRELVPILARDHRVIAPDLRGLGDTPVTLADDYRLPTSVAMVRQLLDHLHIPQAAFVTHDHGGAVLQLLMQEEPGRITRAVMSNVEAYDLWPSAPELAYLKLIVHPVTSPLMFHLLGIEAVAREVFSIAVFDDATLAPDVLSGWTLPHVANGTRWQRLRRFFAWQLDPQHQALTAGAVDALRAFDRPVLLLWGAADDNFGPAVAARLAGDFPASTTVLLHRSSHMPMQEEPLAYAAAVQHFLTTSPSHDATARAEGANP